MNEEPTNEGKSMKEGKMNRAIRVIKETEHYAYIITGNEDMTPVGMLEEMESLRVDGYRPMFTAIDRPIVKSIAGGLGCDNGEKGWVCEKAGAAAISEDESEVKRYREVVECGEKCGALEFPETLEEYRLTLDHYKNHPFMCGCCDCYHDR